MGFQEVGKQKNKLNWERLTRNLCPGCNSRQILSSKGNLIVCSAGCGFAINAVRMQEIVTSILEDQGRDDEWEDWNQLCAGCGKPDMICSCYGD